MGEVHDSHGGKNMVLRRKPEKMRPPGISRSRWEGNIIKGTKESG
jgi:hypothetical protein